MAKREPVSMPMNATAASTMPAGDGMEPGSVSVSALEADVAYFDARLSLLSDEPVTRYQRAQIKTYRTLERLLSDKLAGLGVGRRLTQPKERG